MLHAATRSEEASVQAEECASRALASSSEDMEALDLRVRAMSDRLEMATVRATQMAVRPWDWLDRKGLSPKNVVLFQG